ncbi:hypothetical protein HG537_0G02030 [Torulaspora globosa]|uniref:Uncharacterized protein n=1 Tax=Torulaspora globosa TaxID=48254 RepID=A0A7H9HXK7_9SACH|nr:hypothetical protein HG537_0G02030 [Torulaspora sp. CBS 2947]
MLGGSKDKVKFVPIREVKSEDDYTKVNDIKQLEWFVKSQEQALKSNGFFKAVKKTVETRAETQTLYFTDLTSGRCGFVQLLYSSVMGGVYKGFQLNFKVFRSREDDREDIDIWESFKVEDIESFEPLKVISKEVSFEFKSAPHDDEVVATLVIKVDIGKRSNGSSGVKLDLMVDLFEGFMVKPDGCSYYLEKGVTKDELKEQQDKLQSKKMLRHLFVPRTKCHGTISYETKNGHKVNFDLVDVPGLYIDAVQGLAPQKAACRWNFLCYQDRVSSLLCMEYTTSEDHKRTKVTIWCHTEQNKIKAVGSSINGQHVKFDTTEKDTETGWSNPTSISFPLDFQEKRLRLVNRYDVLGEMPSIVKSLVENLANVKPFIYQYCQDSKYNGESGISIIESTFIS